MKHHPACPDRAHVHPFAGLIQVNGYAAWLDREPIVTAERIVAERVAELLNRHGLADIPGHVPDAMTWGPPRAIDRVIDFRLPEDPRCS